MKKTILKSLVCLLLFCAMLFIAACGNNTTAIPNDSTPGIGDNSDPIGSDTQDETDDDKKQDDNKEDKAPEVSDKEDDDGSSEKDKNENSDPLPKPDDTPTKHKFAGTWYGWLIDMNTITEYKIIIKDDGTLDPQSYYCFIDDIATDFVHENFSAYNTTNDTVSVTCGTDSTLTFDYSEETSSFSLNVNDELPIVLTNENIISVEDFYTNVSGIYSGNDTNYYYEAICSTEMGYFECEIFCYADSEFSDEADSLALYYVANGIIIAQLATDDSLCYLAFDSQVNTLTFEISPTAEAGIILSKTISA